MSPDLTNPVPMPALTRRMAVEAVGTACLVAAVIGSGIMGERLAGGNGALALLANSVATGAVLLALIVALGPVSGAHFNPLVTLVLAVRRQFPMREAPGYAVAQFAGAFGGAALAHLMFGEPVFSVSSHARSGVAMGLSETVATFGLVAIIVGTLHHESGLAPFAVSGYVTGAYWFTSSTCFANPAVTLARSASDTFAGIRPGDAPLFLVCQCAGAVAAAGVLHWIFPKPRRSSEV
jgi:glycerol uptake facilitator-like aquaporin